MGDSEQQNQSVSDARSAEMARAVGEGEAASSVAKRYGCATETVYRACRQHGMTLGRGRRVNDRTLWIAYRLGQGDSQTHIAERAGVTKQRVGQIYDRAVNAGVGE